MMLLLALGCTDAAPKTDTSSTDSASPADSASDTAVEDTSPPQARGAPFLGLTAATSGSVLLEGCTLGVDVVDAATGVAVTSATLVADGRDWSGVTLPAGQRLRATATATGCTSRPDPAPFTSGTFSGEEGVFIVFWYTSVNLGYSALVENPETGDYIGGVVQIRAVDGTTDAQMDAVAAAVSTRANNLGDGRWAIAIDDPRRPIGEVLAALDAYPEVAEASPVWVEAPSWW